MSDKIQSHVASLIQKCHSSLKTSNERVMKPKLQTPLLCLQTPSQKAGISILRTTCIILSQWQLRYACHFYRILFNGLG